MASFYFNGMSRQSSLNICRLQHFASTKTVQIRLLVKALSHADKTNMFIKGVQTPFTKDQECTEITSTSSITKSTCTDITNFFVQKLELPSDKLYFSNYMRT